MPLIILAGGDEIPNDFRMVAYHAVEAPEGRLFDAREFNREQRIKEHWVDHPAKLGPRYAMAIWGEQVEEKAIFIHQSFEAGRLPAFEIATEEERMDETQRANRAEEENEVLRRRLEEETHAREVAEQELRLKTAKEEDLDRNADAIKHAYRGQGSGVAILSQRREAGLATDPESLAAENAALYQRLEENGLIAPRGEGDQGGDAGGDAGTGNRGGDNPDPPNPPKPPAKKTRTRAAKKTAGK